MRSFGLVGLLLAGLLVAVGMHHGYAGGDKGVWKPSIPEPAFKELVNRSAKTIAELLAKAGEDEIKRAQAHAVIIAAYAQSAKVDPGVAASTRNAAVDIAKLVTYKDKLGEAKKVAADLAMFKAKAAGKGDFDPKALVDEIVPLMDTYRTKSKGGDGLPAELQLNPRFKTALNGLEEIIRELGKKKLSDANLEKAAKELEILGYREAAMGSLIHAYAPAKKIGTRDPQEWKDHSLAMRDAAIALAQAAAKKDAEGIHAAGKKLDSACNQCHQTFRGQ